MYFSDKRAELNELRQTIPFYYPKDGAIGFKFIFFLVHLFYCFHAWFNSGTQVCTMHTGSDTHANPKPLCQGKFYIRCMFDPTEIDI